MSTFQDHSITVGFSDRHSIELGGVIETTGLYLNAFVEGNVVQHPHYILDVSQASPKKFMIYAKVRHPQADDKIDTDHAFATLFLLAAGWALTGAQVAIAGPWQDSFPNQGQFGGGRTEVLEPQPLFQDGLPQASRTIYPSFNMLDEVHATLPLDARWSDVKEAPNLIEIFPEWSQNAKASNNIRLRHRSGLHVDLVLKSGLIKCHKLDSIQPEVEPQFRTFTCTRQIENARTWWDAWIGHCSPSNVASACMSVLPEEVDILSSSGSIWRYRLDDVSTLQRPLRVDFGPGCHPTRSIESWLRSAQIFGEAKMVDVAIACSEQAIATAKALRANAPGMAVPLPLGTSIRQLLEDAETEYVRWLDFKESLDKPPRSHDRWNDKVKFRGRHELSKYVGERWQSAIDDLIEAIDNEHFDSQDYHHQIRSIRSFSWYVNGESGSLRYVRLFGSELMYARVPKASMAALGYNFREDIIPSHLEFEEVFTLTLGAAKFWGNVEKRVLISCAEPSDAFFI